MALSDKLKIKVNIVAFVVLGLGLSFAMATRVLSVLKERYTVVATFPDAGGVFTNQEVTYRGLTVGQVGPLRVVPEGVDIELRINEGVDIPAEDVEARVMFKSAVGEQFVDLLPRSDDPPYLKDGSRIPLEQTSIPVSTQELLSTLEAVLRGVPPDALRGAIDALGGGLAGRGQDIATIIESASDLAELFAQRAPEVEGILKKGTTVGGAFLESSDDFVEAIRQLVTVSESLATTTPEIRTLLENASSSSEEVIALIRRTRPDLYDTIKRLARINELQADHKEDLARLLKKLPGGAQAVADSFEPATGLIRFGLVQDDENHACSYGVERRPPHRRGNRRIPPKLNCGAANEQPDAPRARAGDATSASRPAPTPLRGRSLLTMLAGAEQDGSGAAIEPSLPARMSRWSWTLFYLNSM